jgi:hypothetical protein
MRFISDQSNHSRASFPASTAHPCRDVGARWGILTEPKGVEQFVSDEKLTVRDLQGEPLSEPFGTHVDHAAPRRGKGGDRFVGAASPVVCFHEIQR